MPRKDAGISKGLDDDDNVLLMDPTDSGI